MLQSLAITIATNPLLPISGYLVMVFIAAEAARKIGHARRLTRHAHALAEILSKRHESHGMATDDLRAASLAFLADQVTPLRSLLQRDEVLAPICGLAFTMLGWCIAAAGGAALLRDHPDHLMQSVGLGAGASFIGVVVAALSVVLGKALEIQAERIETYLQG